MLDLSKIIGFKWNEGNIDKSYQKHGVTSREAEEVFTDERQLVLEDIKHSEAEKRFTILGKNIKGNILFVAFTVRGVKVRIVSARKANIKERRLYEKV